MRQFEFGRLAPKIYSFLSSSAFTKPAFSLVADIAASKGQTAAAGPGKMPKAGESHAFGFGYDETRAWRPQGPQPQRVASPGHGSRQTNTFECVCTTSILRNGEFQAFTSWLGQDVGGQCRQDVGNSRMR